MDLNKFVNFLKEDDNKTDISVKEIDIYDPCSNKPIFELYDYQKELIKKLYEYDKFFISGARQVGVTTTVLNFILSYCNLNPNTTAIIVLDKIVQINHLIKPLIKNAKYNKNTHEIIFSNGSKIILKNVNDQLTMFRSSEIDICWIDNVGYFDEHKEDILFNFLCYLNINQNVKNIFSTTGFIYGGLFYKIYMEAKSGRNDFGVMTINLDDVYNHKNKN